MKKIFIVNSILFALLFNSNISFGYNGNFIIGNNDFFETDINLVSAPTDSKIEGISILYESLQLQNIGLELKAFQYAMKGYNYLKSKKMLLNKNILSIIDFTKNSSKKRLYILDLKRKKVLYNTLVAHGQASGNEIATNFSNEPESLQSSLGFYTTANTYEGKNGFSLILKGLEYGYNSNAESRAIVMHGAPYVSQDYINETGTLGRSWGCPAVAEKLAKPIINSIKAGTCLFVYSENKKYLKYSKLINSYQ